MPTPDDENEELLTRAREAFIAVPFERRQDLLEEFRSLMWRPVDEDRTRYAAQAELARALRALDRDLRTHRPLPPMFEGRPMGPVSTARPALIAEAPVSPAHQVLNDLSNRASLTFSAWLIDNFIGEGARTLLEIQEASVYRSEYVADQVERMVRAGQIALSEGHYRVVKREGVKPKWIGERCPYVERDLEEAMEELRLLGGTVEEGTTYMLQVRDFWKESYTIGLSGPLGPRRLWGLLLPLERPLEATLTATALDSVLADEDD